MVTTAAFPFIFLRFCLSVYTTHAERRCALSYAAAFCQNRATQKFVIYMHCIFSWRTLLIDTCYYASGEEFSEDRSRCCLSDGAAKKGDYIGFSKAAGSKFGPPERALNLLNDCRFWLVSATGCIYI